MGKEKRRENYDQRAQPAYFKVETWLQKNERAIFYSLIALCLLLSLISFNTKISEANDDALYLEGGSRFVTDFPNYFYTQNAPLYPMFLAVLIKIFGFNLILLKLFSVVFTVLAFVLFYKSLVNRVPAIVFFPVAVFYACNYLIIYYASMTFTEAFYLFLQGFFFFVMVRIIDLTRSDVPPLKYWNLWLLLGFSMFLISSAKSAAIVVIPAVLFYFILEKQWKQAGLSFVSYLLFKLIYEAFVRLTWNAPNQFALQGKILLQKDPYDQSLGNEDLSGFIVRFLENCNLSLSKRFYQLLGWRNEFSTEEYPLLTILTVVIIIIGFAKFVKDRNKYLVALSLFTGAQLALSYIILAVRWDQARITLVLMPILLILALYALYKFAQRSGLGRTAYLVVVFLIVSSTLLSSLKRGKTNLPTVLKNLKGDRYYGYTPDWENFLKASEWCADSLPPSALVASRKAPMSFVYGKGKRFFPVYSVIAKDSLTNQSNPDSALAIFKRNGVTHIILASLRLDPTRNTGQVINTIHNIIIPVAKKYPDKLIEKKVFGVTEQAAVYEFNY
jgi:hypothetical protein